MSPGDRRPNGRRSTNGASLAPFEDLNPGRGGPAPDQPQRRDSRDQELSHVEHTLPETDQTLADADQTSADSDQTSADSDQTSADTDQLAADRDQAASDRDHASCVDGDTYALTREMRARAALQRDVSAQARLDAAARRDAVAHARDLAALARDRAAEARDLAIAEYDEALREALRLTTTPTGRVTGAEIAIRTAGRRKRAAQQRVLAATDRQAAAEDRNQATRERAQAHADREALARQLAIAAIDPLTGALTREAGLRDLDRELERCRRTQARLAIACVVLGGRTPKDSHAREVGDALLQRVAALVKSRLRSYDMIIRHGSEEFVCAMPGLGLPAARARFAEITAALAADPDAATISSGVAQLQAGDGATELIRRAHPS